MPDPIDLEPMKLTDERLSEERLKHTRRGLFIWGPLALGLAFLIGFFATPPWNVFGTWAPIFAIGVAWGAGWPRYHNTIPD